MRLADAVVAMVHAAPPAGALQAAWAINRSIVAHSLTYDSRVLPSSFVLLHAESVDKGVLAVVACVLGVPQTVTAASPEVRTSNRSPVAIAPYVPSCQLDGGWASSSRGRA